MYKAPIFFEVAASPRRAPTQARQSRDPDVDVGRVDPLQVMGELIQAKRLLDRSHSKTDAQRVLRSANLLARIVADFRDEATDFLHAR